jgi:hypothetical protein
MSMADDVLPEDQQEELGDLDLEDEWYSGPSLWSTDWTTETIVNQLKRGNINLNPRFQRRNAWSPQRKSLFIESLVLGLPVPQLVLAEEKGKKGSFIVIDGKQRLIAVRQFASDKDDKEFPQLKLSGLDDKKQLNGLTYELLGQKEEFKSDLNVFDNQTIRTIVIRGWKDEKYLYSVFLRINTGSVQLSPQELRQALHPGPFSDFIDDVSLAGAIPRLLKLREPDFRMRDVELVLRYFAYRNFVGRYEGDLKKFLDETTRELNAAWAEQSADLHTQAQTLNDALEAVRDIFGERDEARKWNGREFEKRINRAVFDVMTYYFSDPAIREASRAVGPALKDEFKRLCETDRAFLSSIEQTTKSRDANRIRFATWADALSRITGLAVASPIA